jgi:hypothetical protein
MAAHQDTAAVVKALVELAGGGQPSFAGYWRDAPAAYSPAAYSL